MKTIIVKVPMQYLTRDTKMRTATNMMKRIHLMKRMTCIDNTGFILMCVQIWTNGSSVLIKYLRNPGALTNLILLLCKKR